MFFHRWQQTLIGDQSGQLESKYDQNFDIESLDNHGGHQRFQSFLFPDNVLSHEYYGQHNPLFLAHYNLSVVQHWRYSDAGFFVLFSCE